jgi:ABC-type nitrate/sulfonate/bicarbonate transport system ATPase subunit
MIRELELNGFRQFERLRVRELTRINLFVGLNNCGKSTVLEAIATLASRGNPRALATFMVPRGEYIVSERPVLLHQKNEELDVRRLFHDHHLELGTSLKISSRTEGNDSSIELAVTDNPLNPDHVAFLESRQAQPLKPEDSHSRWRFLIAESTADGNEHSYARYGLSGRGGLSVDEFRDGGDEPLFPFELISLESVPARRVIENWTEIALTPEQDLAEESLRLLAPDLERIALVQDPNSPTGAFRVKLRHPDAPVPLGSLGGGIWRMFALILALVRSRGGVLLVDEIDTGIHHSVMHDLWRVVLQTAERLDVQVFATTHSLDCVRGLAQVCNDASDHAEDRIAMHRIERRQPESIHYSEAEIMIAASEGIETR